MSGLDDEHIGARIAAQRKLAGLTQQGLAALIPYSYSLLRHVETGHKNATPDLVSAVARALRIDVTALTGQPYTTELQQDRLAELIRPIREALDLYDLGDDPALPVRPTAQLRQAADELCAAVRATRLNAAARALPALVAELTAAAHRAPSTELWQALASTYRTAYDLAVKLGFFDLSTVALDRMAWAADRASDPLLAAVRQYMRALVYFREGEHTIGMRLIARGHGLAAGAGESRAALAVNGQLHLGATVIAARARDADGAAQHLAEASECARRTGEAGRIHWLTFGPANVAAHDLAAHLELGRYGRAWEAAGRLELPPDWPTSRRATVYLDRARAEMETGRTERALQTLVAARKLAPQQTRYHPVARETVRGLVHQRRSAPETLTGLAAWIGL